MQYFLGIDASTQGISAVLIDPANSTGTRDWSVNFGRDLPEYGEPSGFIPGGRDGEVHANPLMWLDALDLLLTRMKDEGVDFSSVAAFAGSGQQHGSVYLDSDFNRVVGTLDPGKSLASQIGPCLTRATSPIWMDTSTGEECAEITAAAGGSGEICQRSGSVAIERFTGAQIRRFFKKEPDAYAKTAVIHLVSSFLASIFAGRSVAIDPGDGAGMNLMNLASRDWDDVLLEATAPGLRAKLPALAPSAIVAGNVASYFVEKYGFNPECRSLLWSGDNPCSLVGMGAARPGKMVISLGTSDTLFAAMDEPRTDPNGFGHVFGNPLGGFMSLICFRNGSLAREAVKNRFGQTWDDFGPAGLARTPVGNGGRVILPFFENEITPRRNSSGATSPGWEPSPDEWVRGVLEGQFLNMKIHSRWLGLDGGGEILLTGGASENDGIAGVVADVFGKTVRRLSVPGSAGLGAAIRAAVAMGVAPGELEEAFSAPSAGRDVQPVASHVAVYQGLEEVFARALG